MPGVRQGAGSQNAAGAAPKPQTPRRRPAEKLRTLPGAPGLNRERADPERCEAPREPRPARVQAQERSRLNNRDALRFRRTLQRARAPGRDNKKWKRAPPAISAG